MTSLLPRMVYLHAQTVIRFIQSLRVGEGVACADLGSTTP